MRADVDRELIESVFKDLPLTNAFECLFNPRYGFLRI